MGTYNVLVRIITTHLSADFDAFAAAVCAVRLYPGAKVLFPGSQELAVRRFLAETDIPFPELKLRRARTETIEHAVVVDTRSPSRLGEVHALLMRDRCPVTIIDHHLEDEDGLEADELIEGPVGATCTLLARLFDEHGIEPTPEEATLMLMGIYEDTGGLSYRETCPEDMRVCAWLLEHGASLAWVRKWVLKVLQPNQLELLNRMVEATEEVSIAGVPVSIAMLEVDRYHEEAAFVVHRWVEIFEIAVGAVLLVRPPNINLILRSRVPGLHVGRVAQRFGGGGHPTAASARTTGMMAVELREALLETFAVEMPPTTTAIDIAAPTVFSIAATATIAEVMDRINRLRVNALSVEHPRSGKLIGMVTRQILDRALSHGMAERPVQTVMQPELPTVPAATPIGDLAEMFLERSLRFVIVMEDGGPAGVITRMELFRRLYESQHAAGSALDHRMAGERPVSQHIARMLREIPPPWVQRVLKAAAEVADAQRASVFLVGGLVRDMLLARSNEDVDLVVEGDGIAFAEALARRLDGRCHPHEPFLTAVITLPHDLRVDVASARTEFYRTPAALPEVATSLIRQDLYRRDFTMNALAVALAGDRYGELVDFFGGRRDIQQREIRVLHSLSFIDDPTRALRAVRYARRLGFTIAADTEHLIRTALEEGIFEKLSGQRLRRELEVLLREPHPTPAIHLIAELGLLPAICPGLRWSEEVRSALLEVEGQLAWYRLEGFGQPPEPWLLHLGALALHGEPGTAAALVERLQLAGAHRGRLLALPEETAALAEAAVSSQARSQLVAIVEERSTEALLLAMASLPLDSRRQLATAAETAATVEVPVAGQQLVDAGLPPGPHVGRALEQTRNALIDGVIGADEALEWALQTARYLLTEEPA